MNLSVRGNARLVLFFSLFNFLLDFGSSLLGFYVVTGEDVVLFGFALLDLLLFGNFLFDFVLESFSSEDAFEPCFVIVNFI